MVLAFDLQAGRNIRGHLAKCILWRANVYRLPVAVEHEHNRLVQYVHHKNVSHRGYFAGEVFVLVEFELAAAVGNAPTLPGSETGVQTSTLSGKWSLGKVLPLRFLGVGQM